MDSDLVRSGIFRKTMGVFAILTGVMFVAVIIYEDHQSSSPQSQTTSAQPPQFLRSLNFSDAEVQRPTATEEINSQKSSGSSYNGRIELYKIILFAANLLFLYLWLFPHDQMRYDLGDRF